MCWLLNARCRFSIYIFQKWSMSQKTIKYAAFAYTLVGGLLGNHQTQLDATIPPLTITWTTPMFYFKYSTSNSLYDMLYNKMEYIGGRHHEASCYFKTLVQAQAIHILSSTHTASHGPSFRMHHPALHSHPHSAPARCPSKSSGHP